MSEDNRLYFGDNLAFLADPEEFPTESVDLIYLDPPFNSNASYNVLFKDAKGTPSAAQIRAFDDTWRWDESAAEARDRLLDDRHAPSDLSALIRTFHQFLGHSPMLAYLVQMAIRLVHMRRVLKPTGSLYLHCDPTASHYLKLVLDGIFGPLNFRNEIIWRRTNAHNKLSKQFGPIHDVVLFFAKSSDAKFHAGTRPYTRQYVKEAFPHSDERGNYQLNNLTGPGKREGESGKAWKGYNATNTGRHWAVPRELRKYLPHNGEGMGTAACLDSLFEQGLIVFPKKAGGQPRYKQYPQTGVPYQDIWAYQPGTRGILHRTNEGIDEDVKWLDQGDEKLGFDTQKPMGLLKRIVLTSSNPGDVILDPFCGCGTTIDAVETLNREHPDQPPRRWIGIDITHLAINLIKARLARFDPPAAYEVIGEPITLDGARALFDEDHHQFQLWACGLVGARPTGAGAGRRAKKGADRGIDGERPFIDGNKGPAVILVQVKGGKPKLTDVRDFRGVIERENAAVGIFITLNEPTQKMKAEAAAAGTFRGVNDSGPIPRLQIATIEELLSGGTPAIPAGLRLPRDAIGSSDVTLKRAKKHDEGSLFQGGGKA